ncbi:MAG: crossover junction endodeoxyribonuclease RuvC [bacterium]
MIILGIDPGTATTGFGVIEVVGMKRRVLDFGVISTDKSHEHSARLEVLHNDLQAIITQYQPEIAGVEKLFFATNVTTAMKVSEARGVILLTLEQAGVQVLEFTPLQVKQSTTGYGQAKKPQMQQMVMKIFGLDAIPKPDDAADALAIALAASHKKTPR